MEMAELSKDQEAKAYIVRAQLDDQDALTWLYQKYHRYIYQQAGKYAGSYQFLYDDLVSTGMIGFMKGIKTFDVNRDVKVLTYLSQCICNQMLMFLRKNKKHLRDVSLYSPTSKEDDHGHQQTYEDLLVDEEPQGLDNLVEADRVLTVLALMLTFKNGRHAKLLYKNIALGGIQNDVAGDVGFSQSYVSRLVKRFKQYAKEYSEREESFVAIKLNMETLKENIKELLGQGKTYPEIVDILSQELVKHTGIKNNIASAVVAKKVKKMAKEEPELGLIVPEKIKPLTTHKPAQLATPKSPEKVTPSSFLQYNINQRGTSEEIANKLRRAADVVDSVEAVNVKLMLQVAVTEE